MTTIVSRDPSNGAPMGRYTVTRYSLRDGRAVLDAGQDTDAPLAYVEAEIAKLGRNEALFARCESQPGWIEAAGSDTMRRAVMASERTVRSWDDADDDVAEMHDDE